MENNMYSCPLSLRSMKINDKFWKQEMEVVRKEVIPYQWAALNDQVEGAAPSFCMRNFKVAGKQNKERKEQGKAFIEPKYTFRGFESLPEDPNHPEDKFYGFVFQDSDFSKWIEAVGYSLTQHPDPKLEAIADGAIDIVCAAQQDDGYLDTYYIINGKDKIFTNLKDHHELYCMGHLIEGAVAYYEATGKDKLLKAAARFADYAAAHFGPEEGKCKGYPGHEIAEMALVRLYEVTKEPKYLELSKFFIDERGKRPYYFDKEHPEEVKKGHENDLRYFYNQAHLPVRQQDEAVGHAVRAVYLYSGMADIARLTEDETLYQSCEKLWDSMANEKMYITGGIGGTQIGEAFSYPYDLPNDTAYAETCASIGLVFFARRMLEIKPDAKYANVMERALYNGILSGMALDGKSFFYVNPLEVWPDNCIDRTSKEHVKPVRQKWFGVACCPPNIARTLASMGQYIYFIDKNTAYVNLYISNEAQIELEEGALKIQIESDLTNTGHIRMAITPDGEGEHRLALRIPDYVKTYTIKRDGKILRNARISQSYLLIKDIKEQTEIEIDFEVPAKFVRANPNVREDAGKVALVKGPLVYCLEETDNGENLPSIFVNTKQELKETFESELLGGVTTIRFTGKKLNMDTWQDGALYDTREQVFEDIELKAIPYHCWDNRKTGEMLIWMKEMF